MVRAVIVTGSDGYIGARLLAMAREEGRIAHGLGRARWALGDGLPPGALDPALPPGAHAVIHLAHDWRDRDADRGVNLVGTAALLASARALGIGQFVFASSQSARADAPNAYGRIKWAAERLLAAEGEVSARVGLVYGGRRRGQYGLLAALVRRAPVLPMVEPWREVQPIHVDEVCRGLLRLADGGWPGPGWVGLAGAPMRFGDVLRTLAREFHGKALPIVPIPASLALFACDLSAAVPFGPSIDRERVLGLAGTRRMDCAHHLAALGLALRPMAERLRDEAGARRALLAEGRTLLGYVLRERPASALVRRYVRGLAALGEAGAIAIPSALRWREPFGRSEALGRRLALATALAEASPQGGAMSGSWFGLGLSMAVDTLALPSRLLRRTLRR